ncbi:MAG: phosphatidate cytidylyltransferase [Chloroflexota bacterium]
MLRKRVVTALWGVPLIILAIWFGGPLPWFSLLAAVWGMLAVIEFYRMTAVSKILPLTCFGLVWTLFFILHPHIRYPNFFMFLTTSAVVLSLILLVIIRQREGAFANWAWLMGGILYVGLLLSFLVALRLEAGRAWLYLALFATFGSDTAAYFIGKAFGRHRLAPRISPGKTWEGAAGGLIGAVIISLLFTLPTPLQLPLGYAQAISLGLLISIFGQFGDLAESLLKRNTGVKDSGRLMPGHGGLLDRMDSVVFAGVVVYLYYIFIVL